MGLTVSGTVTMSGGFLSSLGNVVAFIQANIDQSLLSNFDVAVLMKQYPNDISKAGSMVSFKGPVAIINSPTPFKAGIAGLAALVVGAIAFALVEGAFYLINQSRLKEMMKAYDPTVIDAKQPQDCPQVFGEATVRNIGLLAGAALGTGVAAFMYVRNPLALSHGVHFFGR